MRICSVSARSPALQFALIALMIVSSSSRYLQQASASAEVLTPPPILPGNQDINYYLESYSSQKAQLADLIKEFNFFAQSTNKLVASQINDVINGFMNAEGDIEGKYQGTLLQRQKDTELSSTDVASAAVQQTNIAGSLETLRNNMATMIDQSAAKGPEPVTSLS